MQFIDFEIIAISLKKKFKKILFLNQKDFRFAFNHSLTLNKMKLKDKIITISIPLLLACIIAGILFSIRNL